MVEVPSFWSEFSKGVQDSPLGAIYGPHGLFGPKKTAQYTGLLEGSHPIFGGGSQPQAPSNPNDPLSSIKYGTGKPPTLEDQIKSFASQFNLDPMQVYNDIRTQDNAGLKDQGSLATALHQYAQAKGLGSAGSSNSASVVDPIAIQQFFQKTISPYLDQVAGNEQTMVNQLQNQKPVAGLPAEYQAVIKQGQQNQATDAQLGLNATKSAAAMQPRIDQLMQMLGLVQQAKLKDVYAQAQGQGATTNPFTF